MELLRPAAGEFEISPAIIFIFSKERVSIKGFNSFSFSFHLIQPSRLVGIPMKQKLQRVSSRLQSFRLNQTLFDKMNAKL
jgi:hypothetical protein